MHKQVCGRGVWLAGLLAMVFVLGGLIGYWLSSQRPTGSAPSQDHDAIFQALVRASALSIPKAQVHCEVAGPSITTDQGAVRLDTKLGDYIASYLAWSQHRTRDGSSNLACEGNDILKCTWQFGEAKASEGWERYLVFEYNAKTSSIIQDSLECVDVP